MLLHPDHDQQRHLQQRYGLPANNGTQLRVRCLRRQRSTLLRKQRLPERYLPRLRQLPLAFVRIPHRQDPI